MFRRFLLAGAGMFFATGVAAEEVWVTIDQVRPYTISGAASQIVIGNAGIADVTVQDQNRILIYGKAPGLTNLFVFDEKGEKIDDMIIRVRSVSGGMLTMQRGTNRTTFNCTSVCDATTTVGDSNDSFAIVNAQSAQKVQQASQGPNTN